MIPREELQYFKIFVLQKQHLSHKFIIMCHNLILLCEKLTVPTVDLLYANLCSYHTFYTLNYYFNFENIIKPLIYIPS